VVRKVPLQASLWSDQQRCEISPCHHNQTQQIEITGDEQRVRLQWSTRGQAEDTLIHKATMTLLIQGIFPLAVQTLPPTLSNSLCLGGYGNSSVNRTDRPAVRNHFTTPVPLHPLAVNVTFIASDSSIRDLE
jgi:hypothetical protein